MCQTVIETIYNPCEPRNLLNLDIMNFGHISEEVPKSVDGWLTDLMRQHQSVSLKISKTYLNARKSKQLCHSAVRGLLHQPTLCLGKKLDICRAPEIT